MLQKCVRYEADEKPRVSLTCPHRLIHFYRMCSACGPSPCSGKGGRVALCSVFVFLQLSKERARPSSGLPLLPLAVLFLSCLFLAVVPVLTLIWAWALCQVPLWDGRSEAAGLSRWLSLCIQAALRAASLLPIPLLHVHLFSCL